MKMKEKKEQEIQKKSSRKKYMITAGIFLCIITGYVYKVIIWRPKPDLASERIIREIAAVQLNKDPNDLISEDFTKIKELSIEKTGHIDIKLLEKFTNLKRLIILNKAQLAANRIPKWKIILYKIGILNSLDKLSFDLSPLVNLKNLHTLATINCRVIHIEKLGELKNLQTLLLYNSDISNFKPLMELKNLQILNLNGTQVSDLKPLKDLTGLKELYLTRTQVSNLEPLKGLKNLKTLEIIRCPKITDQQVDDLQKALPNLEIIK